MSEQDMKEVCVQLRNMGCISPAHIARSQTSTGSAKFASLVQMERTKDASASCITISDLRVNLFLKKCNK